MPWLRGILMVTCTGLALACGDSADEQDDLPSACQKEQRQGTFLFTYTEHAGGTCGPIPSAVVSLRPGAVASASNGCQVTSEVWTENDCKLETSVQCPTGSKGTFVSRQVSADGGRLEGIVTYQLESGGSGCVSTYDLLAVRQ